MHYKIVRKSGRARGGCIKIVCSFFSSDWDWQDGRWNWSFVLLWHFDDKFCSMRHVLIDGTVNISWISISLNPFQNNIMRCYPSVQLDLLSQSCDAFWHRCDIGMADTYWSDYRSQFEAATPLCLRCWGLLIYSWMNGHTRQCAFTRLMNTDDHLYRGSRLLYFLNAFWQADS